jgi:uncharacterized Zn-binding protein involved in type VI secretion
MSALSETLKQTVSAKVEAVQKSIIDKVAPPDTPPATGDPPKPEPPNNPVRTVVDAVGAVQGILSAPVDLMNNGFAAATGFISDMLPKFPAATMGSLYIGPPHAHAHPPSLIPPAPPVPLPSIGPILIGCSPTVLVGGMPAARAGDIGMAPTCGGFMPGFEVFTGSSKVFIRGTRAARILDLCRACTKAESTSLRAAVMAQITVTNAIAVAGIAANAIDAAQNPDADMAAAQGIAAAAGAADLAAGIAAAVVSALLGSDPGVPPGAPGMITIPGAPNVLIGGFPMPNFPDPAQKILGKLKNKAKAAYKARKDKRQLAKQQNCKSCG